MRNELLLATALIAVPITADAQQSQFPPYGPGPAPLSTTGTACSGCTLNNLTLTGTTTNTGTISGGVDSPVQLYVNQNLSASGSITAANTWEWLQGSITGSWVAGSGTLNAPFGVYISGDNATTAAGTNSVNGFQVRYGVSAGHTGYRQGIVESMQINGAPASGNPNYVGGYFGVLAASNLGGTNTSFSTYNGSIFGDNPQVIANSSATYLDRVTGTEIDAAMQTGSSAAEFYGATIVQQPSHAVRGTFDDAGLLIGEGPGAITHRYGIIFGNDSNQWPIGSDGTIIYAEPNSQSPTNPIPVAKSGVDFRAVNFSAGGAEFAGPNFSVGNTGALSIGNFTETPSSSGLTIAAANTASWTAGVSAAGTAYTNGDVVYDLTNHSIETVTASGGTVTALTVIAAPVGTVSNPVTLLGGTGHGLTGSFTATSSNTLSIAASVPTVSVAGTLSAGTLALGGNTFTAVQAPATCNLYSSGTYTWTKLGTSSLVWAWAVGGGGGGGFGATLAASGSGGAGGGGGAMSVMAPLPASLVTSTVTVVAGAAGAASTSGTTTGGIGTASTFGNYLGAGGGGGGGPGSTGATSGGGGGGGFSGVNGGSGTTTGGSAGSAGINAGGSGVAATAVAGYYGPGAGGSGSGATGTAAAGAASSLGAASGGAGGGFNVTTGQNGAAGNGSFGKGSAGGTLGTGGASCTVGGPGVAPNIWPANGAAGGGGGGGGITSGTGCQGGQGGLPGGGGGGGGSGSVAGGPGGAGGAGEVEVCQE